MQILERQNWHVKEWTNKIIQCVHVESGWFYQLEVYSAFLMLLSGRCWVYPSVRRMQPTCGAKPIKKININDRDYSHRIIVSIYNNKTAYAHNICYKFLDPDLNFDSKYSLMLRIVSHSNFRIFHSERSVH